MAKVWIPSLMRDIAGGQELVTVPGETVGQVVDHLDGIFPGFRDRLCPGGQLSSLIAVAVDGRTSRLRLLQPLKEDSEVHFIPAVAGGSDARCQLNQLRR